MTPLRPALSRDRGRPGMLVLCIVGALVATGLTVWACARSPVLVDPTTTALWRGAFVASYAGVGIYTWWRRPESRLGRVLIGAALLYSLVSFNAFDSALPFTLGMTFWAANIVNIAYLYLCFPRGWLESRLERWFWAALAASTALVWVSILLLAPRLPAAGVFNDCGTRCPPNALQVVSGLDGAGVALATVFSVVFTIGLLGIGVLIFNKARSSARLRRRAMTPLTAVFLLMLAQFVIALFVTAVYPETRNTFKVINGALSLMIPAAILVGQIRGNVFAAVSLGQIAVRAGGRSMTPATAESVIGDALGDSTLRLALWDSETDSYVDVDGVPIALPQDTRTRSVTRITQADRPLAALIHDASLDTEGDVVEGLAATTLMLLENSRLVEELHASRARLVETADRERRRLERDLHDGAQQRLIAMQIRLAMMRELVEQQNVAEQLDELSDHAQAALDELRALAHGSYLGGLEDLGPVAALRELTDGSPVPVEVTDEGVGRLSPAIEAAVYFCAREAIQNATKHAGPEATVAVTIGQYGDEIALTVSDDGAGLPPAAEQGSGIVGMRDRIEAMGGRLTILSHPGEGTTVRATVPSRSRESVA